MCAGGGGGSTHAPLVALSGRDVAAKRDDGVALARRGHHGRRQVGDARAARDDDDAGAAGAAAVAFFCCCFVEGLRGLAWRFSAETQVQRENTGEKNTSPAAMNAAVCSLRHSTISISGVTRSASITRSTLAPGSTKTRRTPCLCLCVFWRAAAAAVRRRRRSDRGEQSAGGPKRQPDL